MAKFIDWLFLRGAYAPEPAPEPAPAPPPGAGGLTAIVSNSPALVAIYAPGGATAQVRRDDLDDWLASGFRLTRFDLGQEVFDLQARFSAATESLEGMLHEVERHGEHHPATLTAAQVAVREVTEALRRIMQDVELAYATSEPDGVAMRDTRGRDHTVDPGQVAAYVAEGWVEVAA